MRDKTENISSEELIEKFGSPLFVLDKTKLTYQFNRMGAGFRTIYPKTSIAYSYKTNYLPYVCKALDKLGCQSEIIPGFEFDLAKRLGIAGDKIIVNGPFKPKEELVQLMDYGCKINVDNLEEMKTINDIAVKSNKIFGIGIRVNVEIGNFPWRKFGFNIENNEAFDAATCTCRVTRHMSESLSGHLSAF